MPFLIDDLLAGAAAGKLFSDGTDSFKHFLQLPPSQRLYRLLWHDFGTAASMSRDEFYAFANDSELQAIAEGLIAGTQLPNDAARDQAAARIETHLCRVAADQKRGLAEEIATLLLRGYPLATKDIGRQVAALTTKLDTQFEENRTAVADLQSGVDRLLRRGGPQGDLAAALLAGPLSHAGKEDVAAKAQELAAGGDHRAAADAFLDVAKGLDQSGLVSVAETYRLQACDQLEAAGDRPAALELLEGVICAQLDRGSPDVWLTTSKLGREGDWLSDALRACADWPHQPWAPTKLQTAIATDTDQARRMRWLAALTQIHLALGEEAQVLTDIPAELPALNGGHRFLVELDRLDALETVHGPHAVDDEWANVEAWAGIQADPTVQGLCWQRRGYLLARRGELEGMRNAYRRAMAAWSRVDGYSEQVADCLFSMQQGESHLGIWEIDTEVRPLAAAMRSSALTPASTARRLQDRAASNRIAGRFREAHRDYLISLAAYRSVGSLEGVLHVSDQLAELFAATDHLPEALSLFIQAGNGKQAMKTARAVSSASVTDIVGPRAPRWERIAIYQVLEVLGTAADSALVAAIAYQLLSDAAIEPVPFAGGELAEKAKLALSAVSLQLPADVTDEAFRQLQKDLRSERLISAAQAAASALFRATQIGVFDGRDDLTDCFLAEHPISRVEPYQLADLIGSRPDLCARVVAAAEAGSMPCVQVLLWAAVDEEPWTDMRNIANELTIRATALQTLAVDEIDGQVRTTHIQGANFAPGGLAALWADAQPRAAFVDRVLSVINSDQETEMNRVSAASGLFNCAKALTPEQRQRALVCIKPISRGQYESVLMGSARPDLLSNVQITSNAKGKLRESAIQLLGRLWDLGIEMELAELREIVLDALRDPEPMIRAAGVEVMRRVRDVMQTAELLRMLPRETAEVRREIALTLGANAAETIQPHINDLACDPQRSMRWAVIDIAAELGDGATLAQIASRDPDSYTRGLARLMIDRLPAGSEAVSV
jgi:hypothetical protein